MITGYTKVGQYDTDFEVMLARRDAKEMADVEKYGSCVDRLLHQYGLEWKLNPYRIVRKGTEEIVQKGPEFDLRRPVLAKLQKTPRVSPNTAA